MSFLDRLFPSRHQQPSSLDSKGLLLSDLWIDQPDAQEQIAARHRRGEIDDITAERLAHFEKRGYLKIPIDVPDEIYSALQDDVDSLWRDKPSDVAYAYHSLLTRFSDAKDEHRKPSCRIADLHTYSEAALSLFFNRQVFDYVELIFGEKPVATQSLYFEWGSQQGLHRDPVYVQMTPPSHLLASWLALEDIGPDCGPLIYVPGSHRLPYYPFGKGRHTVDFSRDTQADIDKGVQWDEKHCRAAGLELETLTCQQGEVLIWHHSLLHGGSYPTDNDLTRKSFVVHYSTLASMKMTQNSYVREPGQPAVDHLTCRRILERDGRHGFDSPLHASTLSANGA